MANWKAAAPSWLHWRMRQRVTSGSKRAGQKHLRPEYAKRLRAEKQAGGSGWETIRWKQRLYEDMCIEIARANYAMLKERTLPPRVA